jgi:protein O-mannosyl-transferase
VQILPPRKTLIVIIFSFFAVTFVTYGASLWNELVLWDDTILIIKNNALREMSFTSLWTIFTTYDPELYIPLTFFSYQIDELIAGQSAFIYHFTNLVLHTLNALLVSWFVLLLSKKRWLALFCGIFFAIHPLHTEAVAWASARKDVLSTLFFLGVLTSYCYYIRVNELTNHESRVNKSYIACITLFLLSLLAKVVSITLPVLLLLIDWYKGRDLKDKKVWTEKIPFFVLSIIFGIIAILGKQEVTAASTLTEKILMAFKSTLFYIEKLFLPFNLSVIYPYEGDITLSSGNFIIPIVIVSILVFMTFSSAIWMKRLKIPHYREMIFGILFFLVTLLPTFINFSKGGENYYASDRYAYIPSIGILFIVGTILLFACFRDDRARVLRQRLTNLVTALLCIALLFVILSFRQSLTWKNNETLFLNSLRLFPNSHIAHNNLGAHYRLKRELNKAEEHFKTALDLNPMTYTYGFLAQVYAEKGQTQKSIATYEDGLLAEPENAELHFGLGTVYAFKGDLLNAESEFEETIRLEPSHVLAHHKLGVLYGRQDLTGKAIEQYGLALKNDPFAVESHYNLAVELSGMNQKEEALSHYKRVLKIDPTHIKTRVNLAIIYFEQGDTRKALEELQKVLRDDPDNSPAKSAVLQISRGI